ncbi:hypothetical protein ACFXTI_035027 [Malus domestica]
MLFSLTSLRIDKRTAIPITSLLSLASISWLAPPPPPYLLNAEFWLSLICSRDRKLLSQRRGTFPIGDFFQLIDALLI